MSITLVSAAGDGTQGNNVPLASPTGFQISADGRYVVFTSFSNNLVPGDTNSVPDVFLKDLTTGAITRVSTTGGGAQGVGGGSSNASISADGHVVVFESGSSNLAGGDTNGTTDIFLKNLDTGAITRVSTAGTGALESNGLSNNASVSSDGRYVAFQSIADNLVAGDTNNAIDIFVKDMTTGEITRVNTANDGAQTTGSGSAYATISGNGQYVAFQTSASNLVSGDTNGRIDIFVKNLATGGITRVNTTADGSEVFNGNSNAPSISANGRYVAFQSNADNLVSNDSNGGLTDIYVKDLVTGEIRLVSTAADGAQALFGSSYNASISADGRYVAFQSDATNLVADDTNNRTDIFVKDLVTGAITRLSVADDGTQTNDISSNPSISADGSHVAFLSSASNLVPGDANHQSDIFVATVPCYVTGTRILTARGEVPVEALRIDDVAVTASGEHRPIRWIGHRPTEIALHPRPETVLPVRIRAGAVAPSVPARDVLVSPGHAIAVDGVLVKAGRLVNSATISQEDVARVTYSHVELDSHDLLVADGMAAESYVECGNRHAFANGGPVMALHPEFDALNVHAAHTCLPLVDGGPALVAIREILIARAGAAFSAYPAVRLLADGVALTPSRVVGWRYQFSVPEGTQSLRLVSRSGLPCQVLAASTDQRRLGVRLRDLSVDGSAVPCEALGDGWHAPTAGRDHRWSNGDAALPIGRDIAFTVSALDRYPVADMTSHRAAA